MVISGILNDAPAPAASDAVAVQRKDSRRAPPTDAEKQGKAFIATMGKLPEFVRKNPGSMLARNKIVLEHAQYDKYIRAEVPGIKPDAALAKKLSDDVRAQRNRISFETLNQLANVRTLGEIRDELRKIRDDAAALAGSKDIPSRLSEHCLTLQINILIARSARLRAPADQRTIDDINALLADLKSGVGKKLHDRGRPPYDRRGEI